MPEPEPEKQKPSWLRVRLRHTESFHEVKAVLRQYKLHSVCREAQCPNIHECFSSGTATFLIMGNVCTRNCPFCAVKTGKPEPLHPQEPARLARGAKELNLKHVVVTSVNRDDLPDGGAAHFAQTVTELRKASPGVSVEVLTPDFKGDELLLEKVFEARPEVFAFNIETVAAFHPLMRAGSSYELSLKVLRFAASQKQRFGFLVKSGFMAGMGENETDVLETLKDLAKVPCDIVTIGQYLAPSPSHHPVHRYVSPSEFKAWKEKGENVYGIPCVTAGSLVRSSYRAEKQMKEAKRKTRFSPAASGLPDQS